MQIAAGEFKASCLRLMDKVNEKRCGITITKRGKPVARLVPIDNTPPALFGCMKGRATVNGDIVAPTGETWDADR